MPENFVEALKKNRVECGKRMFAPTVSPRGDAERGERPPGARRAVAAAGRGGGPDSTGRNPKPADPPDARGPVVLRDGELLSCVRRFKERTPARGGESRAGRDAVERREAGAPPNKKSKRQKIVDVDDDDVLDFIKPFMDALEEHDREIADELVQFCDQLLASEGGSPAEEGGGKGGPRCVGCGRRAVGLVKVCDAGCAHCFSCAPEGGRCARDRRHAFAVAARQASAQDERRRARLLAKIGSAFECRSTQYGAQGGARFRS